MIDSDSYFICCFVILSSFLENLFYGELWCCMLGWWKLIPLLHCNMKSEITAPVIVHPWKIIRYTPSQQHLLRLFWGTESKFGKVIFIVSFTFSPGDKLIHRKTVTVMIIHQKFLSTILKLNLIAYYTGKKLIQVSDEVVHRNTWSLVP